MVVGAGLGDPADQSFGRAFSAPISGRLRDLRQTSSCFSSGSHQKKAALAGDLKWWWEPDSNQRTQ